MPEPGKTSRRPSDGYRSPFADDPAVLRNGRRAYRILIAAFIAFDLLLLGSAIAAPTVGVWVWLVISVAAQAALVGYLRPGR